MKELFFLMESDITIITKHFKKPEAWPHLVSRQNSAMMPAVESSSRMLGKWPTTYSSNIQATKHWLLDWELKWSSWFSLFSLSLHWISNLPLRSGKQLAKSLSRHRPRHHHQLVPERRGHGCGTCLEQLGFAWCRKQTQDRIYLDHFTYIYIYYI